MFLTINATALFGVKNANTGALVDYYAINVTDSNGVVIAENDDICTSAGIIELAKYYHGMYRLKYNIRRSADYFKAIA